MTPPPTWTTVAGELDVTLACSDGTGLTAAQAAFPVAVTLECSDGAGLDSGTGDVPGGNG